MSTLSNTAASAIIYTTLACFLVIGIYAGRKLKGTDEFFRMGFSQKPLLLGVNFFAAGMGAWVLYSLPEIATAAGILGVVAYVLACVLPLGMFAVLGPYVRSHSPDGFTISEYIKKRFGLLIHWIVSLVSVIFMVVYMTAEMTSINGVISLLTHLDPLVPVAIIAAVTTIYTTYGGFRSSLVTDGFQGYFIVLLIIIGIVAVSTTVTIVPGRPTESGLLEASTLGWKMILVLPISVCMADLFHQGFWQRVYAAESTRALWQSTAVAAVLTIIVTVPLSVSGLVAVWSEDWTPDSSGSIAFFTLISTLPTALIGISLVLAISLVCSSVDTLQSALSAIIGGDLLNNRLDLKWVRVITVLANVPAVAFSLKQLDVLQVFSIGNLLAAATFPPLLLGLFPLFSFVNHIDVIVGMIAGILTVPIVGTVAYGDFGTGWTLWVFPDGLYVDTWEVFAVFLLAPIISTHFTLVCGVIRTRIQYSRK
jgi:Na+/proline symporter